VASQARNIGRKGFVELHNLYMELEETTHPPLCDRGPLCFPLLFHEKRTRRVLCFGYKLSEKLEVDQRWGRTSKLGVYPIAHGYFWFSHLQRVSEENKLSGEPIRRNKYILSRGIIVTQLAQRKLELSRVTSERSAVLDPSQV
jgi:hypothetical protein